MGSKIPKSSKEAFKAIIDIINRGLIDIPPQFNGSGAPGETLEYLCDIKRNNNDTPDLKDWEVKFHGRKSLLTLLHKNMKPQNVIDVMIEEFGWDSKDKEQINFRHTIRGKSKRGFEVKNTAKRITVHHITNKKVAPYWEVNIIMNSLIAKLRRLIVVHGTSLKATRQVRYENATAFWDLRIDEILPALESGLLVIDFDARTTKGRGSSTRDHGTKIRVDIKKLHLLYDNTEKII